MNYDLIYKTIRDSEAEYRKKEIANITFIFLFSFVTLFTFKLFEYISDSMPSNLDRIIEWSALLLCIVIAIRFYFIYDEYTKLNKTIVDELKGIELKDEELKNFKDYVSQSENTLCVSPQEKIDWAIEKLKKVRKLVKEYR